MMEGGCKVFPPTKHTLCMPMHAFNIFNCQYAMYGILCSAKMLLRVVVERGLAPREFSLMMRDAKHAT